MRSGAPLSPRLMGGRFGLPAALVALLSVIVVAVIAFGDDDDVTGAPSGADGRAAATDAEGGGSSDGSPAAGTSDTQPIRVATPESPLYDARPEEIPLEVELSTTEGLSDGDVVTLRVEPEGDATEVYGFTAFLCRGDVDVRVDAQARPTSFGYCASQPLSPGTDSLVEIAAQPPYQVAEGEFRVGVGSDTFELRDGSTATVTCGPDDPCQLVLKLQFPNGYGLRSFPLTFR